jgi:drug/metabolite transporter (DMT)-like permease
MHKLVEHSYLLASLFFAGLSQIIVRWQMSTVGQIPGPFWDKLSFVFRFFTKPWVCVAILSTFCSAVCWMLTLTRFELSYAYPWTSLLYIYLLIAGLTIFGDAVTFNKILGTVIIIVGVYFIAKG